MKTVLNAIKTRRSIRKYTQNPIPRNMLLNCIEAARYAPSACNSQPWKFIIVDDAGTLKEIVNTFSGFYQMNFFAKEAPALALIVQEKQKAASALGAKIMKTDFRLIDIGIACDHFVLQAAEEGIGRKRRSGRR